MKLRNYQTRAIESINKQLAAGKNKQVAVLATGLGKTIIFSDLISQRHAKSGKKALILAHREELLTQAKDKLNKINPELTVSIEMADKYADDNRSDVIVASVATLGRLGSKRLERFDPAEFDTIVIDEAHHASATTYQNILGHFGVLKVENIPNDDDFVDSPENTDWNNEILLLGVTATPNRNDNQGIDQIFDEVVFNYGIIEGIQDGFLSRIRAYRINTHTSLEDVHTRAGDFAQDELADAINNPERNSLVVKTYLEQFAGKQALVFAIDVKHAQDLLEVFTKQGIKAAMVDGTTPKDQRAAILKSFHEKEIQVVINCMVLCLDTQTEILTNNGWRTYQTIEKDDLVANYKMEDEVIEWHKPQEIVVRELYSTEQMTSTKTDKTNIRVTNTHRIVYRTQSHGKWKKKSAEELIGKHFEYPIVGKSEPRTVTMPQSSVITTDRKNYIRYTSSLYKKKYGWTKEKAETEAAQIYWEKSQLTFKHYNELSSDECKLIGFWLGDGGKTKLKSGGIEYMLHQNKKEIKGVEWVDNLLENLHIDNIKREKKSVYSWSIPRGTGGINQQKKGLYCYEPYLQKNGTSLFWAFTRDQIIALLEGFWVADGNHSSHFKFSGKGSIDNCNTQLMDLLQAICVCREIGTTISKHSRICYSQGYINTLTFNINKTTRRVTSKFTLQKEEYKPEKVWCVKTTTKNIITRREGRVCIMGNTEGYDNDTIDAVMLARPTKSGILYQQMIGRGTRTHEDKSHLAIVDFVDNLHRHTIKTSASLLGIDAMVDFQGEDIVSAKKEIDKIRDLAPSFDLNKLDFSKLDYLMEEVDLMAGLEVPKDIADWTPYAWHRFGENDFRIGIGDSRYVVIRKSMTGQHKAYFEYINEQNQQISEELGEEEALSLMVKRVDSYIERAYPESLRLIDMSARWRKQPPSEKQIDALKRLRVSEDVIAQLDKGRASQLQTKLYAMGRSVRKW